jgi:hypothetical protein
MRSAPVLDQSFEHERLVDALRDLAVVFELALVPRKEGRCDLADRRRASNQGADHPRVDAAKVAFGESPLWRASTKRSTACSMLPNGRRSTEMRLMSQPSPADLFLSGDTPPSTSGRALQARFGGPGDLENAN